MKEFQEQLKKFDGFYTKVLESMENKKKIDLDVMDRKPDITPKVGDWVKIKSKEWYENWKDSYGTVHVRFAFTGEMKKHCGRIYKIRAILSSEDFYIDVLKYTWSMEMFEQVYPQEEYRVHKTFFGDIVVPITKGSTAMEAIHSKEGRFSSHILPNDGTLLGCDYQQMLDKAFPSYMPSIKDLTDPCTITCKVDGSVLPFPPKQSAQVYIPKPTWLNDFSSLSKPETKLRIIKTNQLIKIEKL